MLDKLVQSGASHHGATVASSPMRRSVRRCSGRRSFAMVPLEYGVRVGPTGDLLSARCATGNVLWARKYYPPSALVLIEVSCFLKRSEPLSARLGRPHVVALERRLGREEARVFALLSVPAARSHMLSGSVSRARPADEDTSTRSVDHLLDDRERVNGAARPASPVSGWMLAGSLAMNTSSGAALAAGTRRLLVADA